ncbi:MAG: tetratricopeptide repeat protein [Muribaculaceae bacterium]|nr:tetratricopeptide repeat protein [Muribaculaceae bacterium]
MKKYIIIIFTLIASLSAQAQINTDQVLRIGRNALYFEDYVLSIQYFNQIIAAKPYLAQPYFYRALAKFNLEDFQGAEDDASTAIEHNPFITDAYELRGVARQNMGKHKEAVEDYDKVLSMLPENRGVLYNKALALVETEQWDDAGKAFSDLLERYPRFDGGYLGRARMLLAKNDTVSALDDVTKALELNKNSVNGYVMRADINMTAKNNYQDALNDMDEAIRLQPKVAGFFINRAYLRYKLDDYFGAMSDYDYAIQLEPDNFVAHFNRAMLCAEVKDFDKALADYNYVLKIHPDEYRTLYNRALIYRERGEYDKALADINTVLAEFPTLAAAYFLRFDIKRAKGDRSADSDYKQSLALAKQRIKVKGKHGAGETDDLFGTPTVSDGVSSPDDDSDSEPQEVVAARFTSLLTMSDNSKLESEYSNKSIRGKVQDRNMSVEIEPMFTLTYYMAPTELKPSSDFMREIEDINRTRMLRYVLQVTNHEPTMSDEESIRSHFESIDYYNSYLSTHKPRAIDYFGRGMDHMTVHNFKNAIADFTKASELAPDFTLAFFMRAIASYRDLMSREASLADAPVATASLHGSDKAMMTSIIADFDHALELSPTLAVVHFNKGVIYMEMQDITSAINAFNQAIELRPGFGEAYYNRGYAYLKLGNRKAGMEDLSKAGELGIVPSYSVLKRMSR